MTTVKDESVWKFFTVKTSGQVFRVSFPNECNASLAISDEIEPSQLFFNQPGTYPITLTAYDEFGNRDDTTQFVTITAAQAPSIAFQSDQCFGGTSTLTATADQTLSSVNWSITDTGNTTITRTGQSVTYDFPAPAPMKSPLKLNPPTAVATASPKRSPSTSRPLPASQHPWG